MGLKAYVGALSGVTTVDYNGLRNDARFKDYLDQLAAVDLASLRPSARLALCLAMLAPVPRIFFPLFFASFIALRDVSFFTVTPFRTILCLGSNLIIDSWLS